MATNRTIRSLSQYIASNDDLRPPLQGVVCHGKTLIATDGHSLMMHKGTERHFDKDGLYKINQKVKLNGKFNSDEHEPIENEEYPDLEEIFRSVQEQGYFHEATYNVHVLIRMLRFIEKTFGKTHNVTFKFPMNPSRPMTVVSDDIDLEESIQGIVMPVLSSYGTSGAWSDLEHEISEFWTDEKIEEIQSIIDDVNSSDDKIKTD